MSAPEPESYRIGIRVGRAQAIAVLPGILTDHQRMDIKGCLCGWADIGKSHAVHVAQVVAGYMDRLPYPH